MAENNVKSEVAEQCVVKEEFVEEKAVENMAENNVLDVKTEVAEQCAAVKEEFMEENVEHDGIDCDELHQKIIRQIEYYFGDHNLGRDKFLRELTATNEDGWVPLETLIKFKRLQSLSTDFKVITTSINKSVSGLLEVSEDGTKIRRSKDKPLPAYDKTRRSDVDSRTAYVKGFPENTTIDELLGFFKNRGNVEHIQMRYRNNLSKKVKNKKTSVFKGSVFIVFPTKEELGAFLTDDGEEKLKYGETVLLRESKETYIKRKIGEREKCKQRMREYPCLPHRNKINESAEKVFQYEKGCVLHLSNLDKNWTRDDFKEVFTKHASVAYVGHNAGDEKAFMRFKEPKAQEVMDKLKESNDGKVMVKDMEITVRVIEGDEEVLYYKEFSKIVTNRAEKNFRNRRAGGRGGAGRRFGRGFDGRKNGRGGKHGIDKNEGEPTRKRVKTENSD